jgi:hypothetical protein
VILTELTRNQGSCIKDIQIETSSKARGGVEEEDKFAEDLCLSDSAWVFLMNHNKATLTREDEVFLESRLRARREE